MNLKCFRDAATVLLGLFLLAEATAPPTGTSRRRAGRTERGPRRRRGTSPPPWEEATARSEPGDTVWIGPGTYHAAPKVGGNGYEVRLVGREGHPIRVRAMPGARATIDGGLNILAARDLRGDPRPGDHRLRAPARRAGAARPLVPERQPALGRAERQRRHGLQVHQPGHPRQQPGRELVGRHQRTASSTAA